MKLDFPGADLLCDEDCECPSLGREILTAFVSGAAPVVVAYVINRLFGKLQATAPGPDDDEPEDEE